MLLVLLLVLVLRLLVLVLVLRLLVLVLVLLVLVLVLVLLLVVLLLLERLRACLGHACCSHSTTTTRTRCSDASRCQSSH